MMKKVLSFILVIITLTSLCACTNGSALTSSPSGSSQITTSQTETQASTSSESTNVSTSVPIETSASPSTKPSAAPATEPTEPPHIHNFRAATCTEPRTCSCGATEGSANGHRWQDATCSEPKICTVCGIASGAAIEHNYSDGKCTMCGSADPDYTQEAMVWIPMKGGTKYHTYAGCSNMKDPEQVTQSEAESRGFTPCKKCH